jgi:hypothetical protein
MNMKLKKLLNLNENINLTVGDIVYLNDIKLKVIDTRPLPFNPPRVVNISTGNEFKLTSSDMNKLSKKAPKLNSFDVEREFRNWVGGKIKEYPNQSVSFVKFIESKNNRDTITLSFTEEVKDGRTPKFNINNVLKLKGQSFNFSIITVTIVSVKYLNTNVDNSSGSSYQRYIYELKVTK